MSVPQRRCGIGYDSHRFGGDGPLILGGVRSPASRALKGHSDADVVAHAVTDALLGAAGLGDIGEHFPDDDPRLAGADSIGLLAEAREALEGRGWRVVNVDITVLAERPRLGAFKAPMAERLARRPRDRRQCSERQGQEQRGNGLRRPRRGHRRARGRPDRADRLMAEPMRIQDTLRGEVVDLEPRDPGRVSIYACGPTVYSRIHVGNARPFVTFALLKRLLEHDGYDVTLVENITDINDKIYAAAREAGVGSAQLAEEMTAAYRADTDRLELGRPDAEPLATETIPEIIDLISALVDRGHAYESEGDVYFAVRTYDEYGKLSNRRLEDLQPADQGEPDEETPRKRDPLDFALWKAQKPGEDTAWDSPWGPGRPGWHIECSAMAEKILGLEFDVHGGGIDLVFPHHENEIAQTEAGRGRGLARVWMHNGMIRFGDEKMAKSVGNIRTLADALDEHGRDALIMYFLSGHYRQPLGYGPEALEQAERSLERIRNFARLVARSDPGATAGEPEGPTADLRDRLLRRASRRHAHAACALGPVRPGRGGQPQTRGRRDLSRRGSGPCRDARRPGPRKPSGCRRAGRSRGRAPCGGPRAGAPRPRLRPRRRAARRAGRARLRGARHLRRSGAGPDRRRSERPGFRAPLRAQFRPRGAARPRAGCFSWWATSGRWRVSATGSPPGRPVAGRRAGLSSTS